MIREHGSLIPKRVGIDLQVWPPRSDRAKAPSLHTHTLTLGDKKGRAMRETVGL
jgi:hypothetical protein